MVQRDQNVERDFLLGKGSRGKRVAVEEGKRRFLSLENLPPNRVCRLTGAS